MQLLDYGSNFSIKVVNERLPTILSSVDDALKRCDDSVVEQHIRTMGCFTWRRRILQSSGLV